ncbi:hypothetical protein HK099_000444 [Clydaea vesicula]|uniref:Zf-CHY-domain-containing protein n=1 Tax=Clydaea vesicula TaxID=447962 RepID=A0AAD5XZ49_9FUNG|nr:hypothetical protein HK099_000444 [Clydaea vesicula]
MSQHIQQFHGNYRDQNQLSRMDSENMSVEQFDDPMDEEELEVEDEYEYNDDDEEEEEDSEAEESEEEQNASPSRDNNHNHEEQGTKNKKNSQKEQEEISHKRQSELRKNILLIQNDTSIPPQDKAKRIQELMTNQWSNKQKAQVSKSMASNKLENKRVDFNLVTTFDQQKTYHDKDSQILGCKHYQRAAKLQAHCCGKWYTCRFCHDEISDHNITRNLTVTMMCMYCNQVQPAGQDCINTECNKKVSKYYCKECKLWDDDPRKNIYHCYDCGICRIGKGLGQDYFHCKKCNVCMAISLNGRHKCIERNLESDCPICGEYMFTSTTTVIFMPCGHCIHYKCHQEYIQTSYQCPTCFKSLANMTEYFKRIDAMLAQHQMPQEYENTQSHIYCNDCEKKAFSKFHFLYHKCVHCNGYNTKVLKTVEMLPEEMMKKNQSLLEDAVSPQDTSIAQAALGISPNGSSTNLSRDPNTGNSSS